MDCVRKGITASELPELSDLSTGELHSLYSICLRKFANKTISLELIFLKESKMAGIILKHSKLLLGRNDKNFAKLGKM